MNALFTNKPQEVLTGLDNVIIPQLISAIPNGRTLDMSEFTGNSISAGWVIITDDKGNYKPLAAHAATDAIYEKTSDVALDNSKTYYAESNGVYTAVATPDVADIATYYEVKTPAVTAGYESLPANWQYAGILAHSLLANRAAATIMTAGQVNEVAAPNNIADVKAAIAAVLPGIQFIKEENA